jgi:choline dehydrogenase-like flavoprotein
MTESEVDLNRTYDAIVVGSGAAGGMAAHVLTTHGLKVLMLEAGKKLPIEQELRSMEWPYDNAHRGKLPPDHHALTFNEYTIRKPPYGPGFEKSKHLHSYVGHNDYVKNIVVDERENPYTGTNFAWVRARCLGGKTNIWGRLSLRFSDYEFKAKSRDGYGENWPISYIDIAPYYDKVDLYLGITGVKENLPYLPDSIFQRPTKLSCSEVMLKQAVRKMGRVVTQYRAGVTSDGLKHNQYRSQCYGRGACDRHGGCDIHAAFDSPTGLIYPAMDTGNLTLRTNAVVREVTVDPNTGKASGVHFIDAQTMKDYNVRARVVDPPYWTRTSARQDEDLRA